MKCFIIAALSADGYIGKDEHHAALWTSTEDKKRFVELTKRAGVVVMGSRTFVTLPRPLKDRVNIVYSHSKTFEGTETAHVSPHELLAQLHKRGFDEVAICGGSSIYTLFMEAGVVNTLYLTIEPIVFGTGIHIFNKKLACHHLDLVEHSRTESGTLFLEYRVTT